MNLLQDLKSRHDKRIRKLYNKRPGAWKYELCAFQQTTSVTMVTAGSGYILAGQKLDFFMVKAFIISWMDHYSGEKGIMMYQGPVPGNQCQSGKFHELDWSVWWSYKWYWNPWAGKNMEQRETKELPAPNNWYLHNQMMTRESDEGIDSEMRETGQGAIIKCHLASLPISGQ